MRQSDKLSVGDDRQMKGKYIMNKKIKNVEDFKVVSRDDEGYIAIIQAEKTKQLYLIASFARYSKLYRGTDIATCDAYLVVEEDDGDELLVKLGSTDMKVYRTQPGCFIDNKTGEVAVELGNTIGRKYLDIDRRCPIYVIIK